MSEFVSLTCPSCGGKLQIGHEVERFACGYCGSENVVKRGGGIVSLAPVIDEIKKVQAGVDKTASELAIRRLTPEVEKIKKMEKLIYQIKFRYDGRIKVNPHYDVEYVRMERGIAHIFVEYEKKIPSKLLKFWNGTGFNEEEISTRLYSLSIEDTVILQEYFEKQFSLYSKNFTEDGKEDLERLIDNTIKLREMMQALETLPAKEAELKKHLQIVSQ